MGKQIRVSLGRQLSLSKTIFHLGLKCNWEDYTREEQELILRSERIYFPTLFYAQVFDALGKDIFPSLASYNLIGNKIKQTSLFKMLSIPQPRTRFFFGRNRRDKVLSCFDYPFIGKIPEGSSLGRGVFLIKSESELDEYLALASTAYIQEYIPLERDIRVVVIGRRAVLSYWKISAPGDFRTNVARGSRISFEGVPDEALSLAHEIVKRTGINHAGFDICMTDSGPMVFEANVHFGTEGFRESGLSYRQVIADMADRNEI